MSCFDECTVGDYDPPEFYLVTTVKARKPHQCSSCPVPISVGEPHVRIVGKWDGNIGEYRLHTACHALMLAAGDDLEEPMALGCDLAKCADAAVLNPSDLPEGLVSAARAVLERVVAFDAEIPAP
jgi:hypothetical protein